MRGTAAASCYEANGRLHPHLSAVPPEAPHLETRHASAPGHPTAVPGEVAGPAGPGASAAARPLTGSRALISARILTWVAVSVWLPLLGLSWHYFGWEWLRGWRVLIPTFLCALYAPLSSRPFGRNRGLAYGAIMVALVALLIWPLWVAGMCLVGLFSLEGFHFMVR